VNVSVLADAGKRLLACGPAVNDSAVMLKLPTAAFVVSNAIPVKVGLETETELAPLPVNVMDWLLGPKVICAASAPVPQSATNVIAVRNFVVFMFTVSKREMYPCLSLDCI
jgi:hypothetical protein